MRSRGVDSHPLYHALRSAGLSAQIIRSAWPAWWTEELNGSASGRAELRFALSRKLGLSPSKLLGDRVEFVWTDKTKFKHLRTKDDQQEAILTSFGISLSRLVLQFVPKTHHLPDLEALSLRSAILSSRTFVDLNGLLAACWGLGIPVIHLRVFPLENKSMHAMVVGVEGRYVILLGQDSIYPAPVIFTLAHEVGHIALRHLADNVALIDVADPTSEEEADSEETAADQYARMLLTGSPELQISTSRPNFNAPSLARAVLNAAVPHQVEPGVLALSLAYRSHRWPVAMSALKFIYPAPKPAWQEINGIALNQLSSLANDGDNFDYLKMVLLGDANDHTS